MTAAAFVLASTAATARAQSSEDARRQSIADAWRLRNTGDHAGALSLALQAGGLRMVPQLRRFIAEEQVATGALIDAWNSGVRCVREAETLTGNARAETITACERLLRRLDGRVARVELRLPAEAAGLSARVEGRDVEPEYIRDPIGVHAGAVRVEVAAPGRVSFDRAIDAPQGVMTSVAVELPMLDGSAAPVPVTQRAPSLAPWFFVGAGVSLAASGVFAGLYLDARSTVSSSACYSASQCAPSTLDLKSRGETFGTISLVAGGVGAALAVTGLVLAITAPRRAPPAVTLLVGPRGDGANVGVAGSF